MIPLAALLLQTQTVALTPFFDDGGTTTHDSPPELILLGKSKGRQTAVIEGGTGGTRVWLDTNSAQATLFVDQNHNDKPEASEQVPLKSQQARLPDGAILSTYQAEFSVNLAGGGKAKYVVRYLKSDTKDPDFAQIRNRLVVMSQFGYLGKARFGNKVYKIGIRGGGTKSAFFVDRDGDGVLGTVPAEMYQLNKPFNIGGQSYKLSSFRAGSRPSVAFATSSVRVAEQPMPPDLREGRIVPGWSGPTLTGKTISFPKSFPGKLVLLDIWATWCAPCRAEIPYMRAAYAKFKKRGFEIVSYSVDDPGIKAKVAAFVKQNGTNWTQVYEGKAREGGVYAKYAIEAIPFLLLVDGSTGKILATGDILRGPGLDQTVETMLSMRGR